MNTNTPEGDAERTAREVLRAAVRVIDDELGTEYARKNPQLLATVAAAMMADVSNTRVLNFNAILHGLARIQPASVQPS